MHTLGDTLLMRRVLRLVKYSLMKVSIADVADNASKKTQLARILLGEFCRGSVTNVQDVYAMLTNDFGQSRYRYSHVG
jgi:hypothetical protein